MKTVDIEFIKHERIADGTVLSFFKRPEGFDYLPGQHVVIRFMDIPVSKTETGMRAFTIASSPTEPELAFAYREGISEFKKKLQGLKSGEKASIVGPVGKFVFPETDKDIIMIAGGIGIVPFRVFIKYCVDMKLKNKLTLLYSNPNKERISYKSELDLFDEKNESIKVIHTLTRETSEGWTGETGRINSRLIKENVRDISNSLFYVCGPVNMVSGVQKTLLEEVGVCEDFVRTEKFTGY